MRSKQWRQVKKLGRKRKRLEIKLQEVTHAAHKLFLREPLTYRKHLKVSKKFIQNVICIYRQLHICVLLVYLFLPDFRQGPIGRCPKPIL